MLPFDTDMVATCRREDARRRADAHRAAGRAARGSVSAHSLRDHLGSWLVTVGYRLQGPDHRVATSGHPA